MKTKALFVVRHGESMIDFIVSLEPLEAEIKLPNLPRTSLIIAECSEEDTKKDLDERTYDFCGQIYTFAKFPGNHYSFKQIN